MNLSVGIVGLPNVGKSTLFNALLKKQQALAANYPFATIEPNVGIVAVPDERLEKLAEITAIENSMFKDPSAGPQDDNLIFPPIKPAMVEFVDIAGLVKGASEGEGLGSKFLSHIREVKVIAHVVRVFEDEDVIKEGSVGVKEDYETITMELILADIETLSKMNEKTIRSDKELSALVEKLKSHLDQAKPARTLSFSDKEQELLKPFSLLTLKPEIIVLNVSESDYQEQKFTDIIKKFKDIIQDTEIASAMPRNDKSMVVVCAKIESELSELGETDAQEYLNEMGVERSGLERLIQDLENIQVHVR